MTVPREYVGLWRREGIWRSDGSSDTTTLVLWFQSARWHIDSRGFAGTTVVEGARCEWHPKIAFPALGPGIDAGIMRFEGADKVEEIGVDGSYRELWVRIDAGPVRAQRLERDDGALAWLMTGAGWIAWTHGHPGDMAQFSIARGEAAALPPAAGSGWHLSATDD
ncbi:hypothetical protein CR152_06980 [Massilia violaceinigra]|uniref:Uncharacterized protein n=1 Tax=Massilia violaceinigra TaxID=2045208 RepID=A0A2D2DH18_9BURK|nr:hypothetical protein [Massilia violaceinigra]ATQ74276.1 hypothetical protein CR152_06980 [Massilia violaceinigra]